jgi:hypothetical protein
MRKTVKIVVSILIVLAITSVGFIIWAETPLGPMSEALQALNSDDQVKVTTAEWLVFQPVNAIAQTGFIFYPGGRVDYRSYAPLAHEIASEGYLVIIIHMPLNLAVFSPNAAQDVIETHHEIISWAVGGHSLGGSMAAQYVSTQPSSVKALVLLESYPASGNNLSSMQLNVLTIHGSRDGLVSSAQIDDSLKQLPQGTVRVEILGGNHSQCGWYGSQPGDMDATISREEQQQQIVRATVEFLKGLD